MSTHQGLIDSAALVDARPSVVRLCNCVAAWLRGSERLRTVLILGFLSARYWFIAVSIYGLMSKSLRLT